MYRVAAKSWPKIIRTVNIIRANNSWVQFVIQHGINFLVKRQYGKVKGMSPDRSKTHVRLESGGILSVDRKTVGQTKMTELI